MLKYIAVILALLGTSPALAHSESEVHQGPHGGHIIDAGGGVQHWELVADHDALVLYVTDGEEKPVSTEGGSAQGTVLVDGKTHQVTFEPSGENTLTAEGDFDDHHDMVVIVKTKDVGGESLQARLTPMH